MLIAIITALCLIIFILLLVVLKVFFLPKKLTALQKMLKLKKYKQLIRQCTSILQKSPGSWQVRYLLGKAYLAEGQHNLAITELTTVSKTAVFESITSEIEFRNILSDLLFKFQYYDKAFEELATLMQLTPDNPDLFYKIGHIFESKNDTQKAKAYYERCLSLDQSQVEAHAALGLLYYRSQELVEAEKHISEALRIDSENETVLYYSAKIAFSKKDYPTAIQAFERASRDKKLRAKCYLEKARCYFEAGDTDKARYECERAISTVKNGDTKVKLYSHYLLANCYEKDRRLEKALEQWQIIEKIDPNFRNIQQKLSDYGDIADHDGIKEYLTSSNTYFLKMVSNMVDKKFNLDAVSEKHITNGALVTAKTRDTKQWLGVRTRTYYLYFYRDDNPITIDTMQNIYESMKEKSIDNSYIFTPIGFTKEAKNFAENRPFELYDKPRMEKLFQ